MLEFDSEMNKLVQEGSLIYNDGYGHINRFLEKQESYLNIIFYELECKQDNNIVMYTPLK